MPPAFLSNIFNKTIFFLFQSIKVFSLNNRFQIKTQNEKNMKKFYSIIASVALSTFSFAQGQRNVAGSVHIHVPSSIHSTNPQVLSTYNDTLTNQFFGFASLYRSAGGYVAGNNDYGDLQKQQLFDAQYGVAGAGQITGVCFWF